MDAKRATILAIAALFVIVLIGVGAQCESCRQTVSHWKSNVSGLDRRIVLYANDGSVIRKWEGRFQVEVLGTTARFLVGSRAVTISGTFVIEEIDEGATWDEPQPKKKGKSRK
jgi:hypothetical protein